MAKLKRDKILLYVNIQAGKAALVRNYFSRRNNFHLNCYQLDQIYADVLFRKEELPIPRNIHISCSVSVPCFTMNGSEKGLKMQSDIH